MDVGALVLVESRGPGFLACDNGNGSWNVELDDGTDADVPTEMITLCADQSRELLLQAASSAPPIPCGARIVRDPREVKPDGWTRFVCFSDTHGLHDQIPAAHVIQADVLLHAGDFTNTGELDQIESLVRWLRAYPAEHKVVIAGNHDITLHTEFYEEGGWRRFHESPLDCRRARELLTAGDCTYLEDEAVEICGYRIYGSPWQPAFCDWAFNLARGEECRQKWAVIPECVDVLMTHGPPYGRGDHAGGSGPARVGCEDLRRAIESRAVSVSVAGHVHEGYGTSTDDVTFYVNASTCTHDYRPTNPPIVFDCPPAAELRATTIAAAGAREEARRRAQEHIPKDVQSELRAAERERLAALV